MLEQVARMGVRCSSWRKYVEGEALATLVVNKLRGTLQAAAVKAPGFGAAASNARGHRATTGGKAITGISASSSRTSKSRISEGEEGHDRQGQPTIVEGAGTTAAIEGRVKQLRRASRGHHLDYDREKLQERLAKLVGGVAVIKVGAATETEMKEKKSARRGRDARDQSRREEGIVPGGGCGHCCAQAGVDALKLEGDQLVGLQIIRRSNRGADARIASNAGQEGSTSLSRVKELKNQDEGFNAATDTYEDLVKAGVIDPAKVCSQRAAERLIDRVAPADDEALVSEIPEREGLRFPLRSGGMAACY